jgi:uncharacterized protein YidB (DUF937 family)
MSGFVGQILQGVLGGGGQAQSSSILTGVLQQVLAVKDGDKEGVAAIIQKFQNAGLGTYVQSWVGTGANQPITVDHVGSVFSPEQLQGWAQQAGTTPDAIRDVLAQAIPHVVDHLTPGGQVPAQTPPQMVDLAGILGKLMGATGSARTA